MSQGRKTAMQSSLFIESARVYAHIPQDPFYQRLLRVLDLTFLYELTAPLYATRMGRPSLDPVIFFKCLLFGFFENVTEDTRLELRIAESITARRFLGYTLEERTPDESTLRKTRQWMPEEVFHRVFQYVLAQCAAHGLVRGRAVGIDSTTVAANASMETIQHRTLGCTYAEYLVALRAQDPEASMPRVANTEWESPTDPDARIAQMKDGHTDLAYKVNTAVDLETGLILAAGSSTADVNDQQDLLPWVDQTMEHLTDLYGASPLQMVVNDKGYYSGDHLAELEDRGLIGLIKAPASRSPAGYPPEAFTLEEATDILHCPEGQSLRRQRADECGRPEGTRVYRATASTCRACPQFGICTRSTRGRRVVVAPYPAARNANAVRLRTPESHALLRARQTRGEAPFSYFKHYGGFRRIMGRGLGYAEKKTLIAALGWNLLRLLKHMEVFNAMVWGRCNDLVSRILTWIRRFLPQFILGLRLPALTKGILSPTI
jgi:transposase